MSDFFNRPIENYRLGKSIKDARGNEYYFIVKRPSMDINENEEESRIVSAKEWEEIKKSKESGLIFDEIVNELKEKIRNEWKVKSKEFISTKYGNKHFVMITTVDGLGEESKFLIDSNEWTTTCFDVADDKCMDDENELFKRALKEIERRRKSN